jgi:hypothetical protein
MFLSLILFYEVFRVEAGDTGLLLLLFVFFFIYPSLSFCFRKWDLAFHFCSVWGRTGFSLILFYDSFFFYSFSFVLLLCGFLRENRRTVAQKSADRHSRAKGFCGTKIFRKGVLCVCSIFLLFQEAEEPLG